jgi:hypothetical protein
MKEQKCFAMANIGVAAEFRKSVIAFSSVFRMADFLYSHYCAIKK